MLEKLNWTPAKSWARPHKSYKPKCYAVYELGHLGLVVSAAATQALFTSYIRTVCTTQPSTAKCKKSGDAYIRFAIRYFSGNAALDHLEYCNQ